MIYSCIIDAVEYELLPASYTGGHSNTITVIVGKNGTGKSRLLSSISSNVVFREIGSSPFLPAKKVFESDFNVSINCGRFVSKVICVSTSPFDKFPIFKRNEFNSFYSYLGLRGLPSLNLSTAYISRIIASLIRSVTGDSSKSGNVIDVLKYLGYEGTIKCKFSIGVGSRFDEDIISARDLNGFVKNFNVPFLFSYDSSYSFNLLKESNAEELAEAVDVLKRYREIKRRGPVEVVLERDGIYCRDIDPKDILILIRTGLARLRNVSLSKLDTTGKLRSFNLSEASSGEQTVMMALLGIASQIEDNALICIDEPEVCLHPEWQERYIHLLLETFSSKRGCQFIIATHSPQIVAELPTQSCFVMNMDERKVIDSKGMSHKSIDFQLASVFKAPGHRNEYLNRIALNLFTRVSRNKKFLDEDNENIFILESVIGSVRHDDPLLDILEALKGLKKIYG